MPVPCGMVICALSREAAKVETAALPFPVFVMGPGEHFAGAFSSHLDSLAASGKAAPEWILLAGYSGSLKPEAKPGDLVFASQVFQGGSNSAAWLSRPLKMAQGVPHSHSGAIVTVDRLAYSPQEKRELGAKFNALAVDMESAHFARLCEQQGIRWGVVRSIFDSLDDSLHPSMGRWCNSDGSENRRALAWDLALSPGWWWQLPGWARRDHLAGEALAQGVAKFIAGQTVENGT